MVEAARADIVAVLRNNELFDQYSQLFSQDHIKINLVNWNPNHPPEGFAGNLEEVLQRSGSKILLWEVSEPVIRTARQIGYLDSSGVFKMENLILIGDEQIATQPLPLSLMGAPVYNSLDLDLISRVVKSTIAYSKARVLTEAKA